MHVLAPCLFFLDTGGMVLFWFILVGVDLRDWHMTGSALFIETGHCCYI
jgi:hypothetical protein